MHARVHIDYWLRKSRMNFLNCIMHLPWNFRIHTLHNAGALRPTMSWFIPQ